MPSGAGRVLLMCGLPGSGKTTLARRLAAQRAAVRFTPDEWLAQLGLDPFDEAARAVLEERLWGLGQVLAQAGVTVVLDYGFWSRTERDEKRQWCRSHGVGVELHVCAEPFDVLVERVTGRTARAEPAAVPLTREHLSSYLPFFEGADEVERGSYDDPGEGSDVAASAPGQTRCRGTLCT